MVATMSLNRSEQLLSDYVEAHPDEKRFWMDKVQTRVAAVRDSHVVATSLADDLWAYFEERSAVAPPFIDFVRREGLRRTSMRNLAEYWLRLWVEPRPRKAVSKLH